MFHDCSTTTSKKGEGKDMIIMELCTKNDVNGSCCKEGDQSRTLGATTPLARNFSCITCEIKRERAHHYR